jgi:hypothetical protein
MKREDISKLITGDFMFYASDGGFVGEGIDVCENLSFGAVFDTKQSHFEMMVSPGEIVGMNPPHPYRRLITSLSDAELARITPRRPYLPPLAGDSCPFAPGLDSEFQKCLNKVVISHMGDFYDFPLIGWFAGAKFADWIGCPGIAEAMYKRNRDSRSNFEVCSTWGVRNFREAVFHLYGYKIPCPISGEGDETPAELAGIAWLANI